MNARGPKTGFQKAVPEGDDASERAREEERRLAERRRFARIDFNAKARVLKGDGNEEPCLIVNISAGGALLKAKNPPAAGDTVILYIDNVGRFEARVLRAGKHSFAVDYRGRRTKLRRTADALTRAVNMRPLGLDKRGAPRIRQDTAAVVTLENGDSVEAAILDISLTGASIAIEPQPPLGAMIIVGKMTAKVVRRHEKGVGVVFTGTADRMEDVIEQTKAGGAEGDGGSTTARFGTQFGKKGVGDSV